MKGRVINKRLSGHVDGATDGTIRTVFTAAGSRCAARRLTRAIILVDFRRNLARIIDTARDTGDGGIQTGTWC